MCNSRAVFIVRFRHLYRLLVFEQLPIEWYKAIGAAGVNFAKTVQTIQRRMN